jgi:hypothetical protein
VTLYNSLPGTRPDHHLADDELEFFDLDPSGLVTFIRNGRFGADDELAARFQGIRRAAWGCQSYLQFADRLPRRRWRSNPVVQSETEEIVIDLDHRGNPIGAEFTTVTCNSGPQRKRSRGSRFHFRRRKG